MTCARCHESFVTTTASVSEMIVEVEFDGDRMLCHAEPCALMARPLGRVV